jgi:hypothetical protein
MQNNESSKAFTLFSTLLITGSHNKHGTLIVRKKKNRFVLRCINVKPAANNKTMCAERLIYTSVFFSGEGPRSRCYERIAALRLLAQPRDDDEDDCYFFVLFLVMEHRWNEIDRRKPQYSEKNLFQCLRGGRLAANRLSHRTALHQRFSV